MPLSVKDLMKKAKEKGFDKKPNSIHPPLLNEDEEFFSPWQQNSILNENKVIPFIQSKQDNNSDNILDIISDNAQGNKQGIYPDNNQKLEPENKADIKKDNKQEFNRENTEETTRKHRENIERTSRERLDITQENSQITSREQNRVQPGSDRDIALGNNPDNNLLRHYLIGLSGIQKNLFNYALDAANYFDGFNTGFICTRVMAESINCSYDSAKITLNRLIQKGLLIRQKGKGCRGGYIILEIPKHVKTAHLELKRGNHQDNNRDNKPETTVSHYNSSNKITTIGEGWDEIDISPLESNGFRKNHLLQLKNVNIPDVVQESINHFAFALQYNEKVKAYQTPLNVFMGVLKRGEAWVEPNYISPRERAIQRQLEAKKAERARVEKAEKELFDLEFSAWESSLTTDERKRIAPEKAESFANAKLRAYFNENIWPGIKNNS